jgi:hypothetical protein
MISLNYTGYSECRLQYLAVVSELHESHTSTSKKIVNTEEMKRASYREMMPKEKKQYN